MTKTGYRQSEDSFQEVVIQVAKINRWKVAHFRPSRTDNGWRTAVSGDGVGFPDLVLLRGKRMIVAELKSEQGVASPPQEAWLDAFKSVCLEVYLWKPSQWDEIVGILK